MFVDEGKTDMLNVVRANVAGMRIGLYKARAAALAHGTTLAGLTEADYSGYARQTPAYGAAALDGANDGVSTAPDLTFAHNGGGVGNTVKGWFLLNTTTGKLWAAADLPADKTMAAAGDSIILSHSLLDNELP